MTGCKLHNATNGATFYAASYQRNTGDGERGHRHSLAQSFTCLRGRLALNINGETYILGPGNSAFAPSQSYHDLWVLADGTEYVSLFWEVDQDTIDWNRLRREQVADLTPAEIAERRISLL